MLVETECIPGFCAPAVCIASLSYTALMLLSAGCMLTLKCLLWFPNLDLSPEYMSGGSKSLCTPCLVAEDAIADIQLKCVLPAGNQLTDGVNMAAFPAKQHSATNTELASPAPSAPVYPALLPRQKLVAMIADKLLQTVDTEQEWWTSREVTMQFILTLDAQEQQWLLSLQSYRLVRAVVKWYDQAVLKAIATSWKSQPKRRLTLALSTLNTVNVDQTLPEGCRPASSSLASIISMCPDLAVQRSAISLDLRWTRVSGYAALLGMCTINN